LKMNLLIKVIKNYVQEKHTQTSNLRAFEAIIDYNPIIKSYFTIHCFFIKVLLKNRATLFYDRK